MSSYFKGYISSGQINGNKIPSSLQNLKLRDYAKSKNLDFELSLQEYNFKKSYLALNQLKKDIKLLKGVIFFSLYQMPADKKSRNDFFMTCIKNKKIIYFALEDLKVEVIKDIIEIEIIYFIKNNSAKPNDN